MDNLVAFGVDDCYKCRIFTHRHPQVPFYKLPDRSFGLGDTIHRITLMFNIKQCEKCKVRQSILNKMFPYFWRKDITSQMRHIRNKLLKLGQTEFPVCTNTFITEVIPIESFDEDYKELCKQEEMRYKYSGYSIY